MKPLVLNLAEYGPVLASRPDGRKAADAVEEALRSGPGAVLNFRGVEIITPSYLDEILTRAAGVLRSGTSGLLVASNFNDEVRETLELVLTHRKMLLAGIEKEHVELLGGSHQLKETLEAAHSLKEFTSADLAEVLKVKLPNLHQRLKALEQAGALRRRPDETAQRGTRYIYDAEFGNDAIETVIQA
jgi:DNA-binding MarR family transcriptional regulator